MNADRKSFDDLVTAVAFGAADVKQMNQLAELLRTDDQALDEYLLQVDLHLLLGSEPGLWRSASESTESEPQEVRVVSKVRAQQRRLRLQAISVAAVVLSLVIATMMWLRGAGESSEAIVVQPPLASTGEVIADLSGSEIPADVNVLPEPGTTRRISTSSASPIHNREIRTTSLFLTGFSSDRHDPYRLLPKRYQLPRNFKRRSAQFALVGRSKLPTLAELRRLPTKSPAPVVKPEELLPNGGCDDTSLLPAWRPPLWRIDVVSQLSLKLSALTLSWRKIDEN